MLFEYIAKWFMRLSKDNKAFEMGEVCSLLETYVTK